MYVIANAAIRRPTGLRIGAVMSPKIRCPASAYAGPPRRTSGTSKPTIRAPPPVISLNAERPSGVIGLVNPWASDAQKNNRRPGTGYARCTSGNSVVTGRDCVSHRRESASIAHSQSCGAPNTSCARRPRAANPPACAGESTGASACVAYSRTTPPPARGRTVTDRSPGRTASTVPVAESTR